MRIAVAFAVALISSTAWAAPPSFTPQQRHTVATVSRNLTPDRPRVIEKPAPKPDDRR